MKKYVEFGVDSESSELIPKIRSNSESLEIFKNIIIQSDNFNYDLKPQFGMVFNHNLLTQKTKVFSMFSIKFLYSSLIRFILTKCLKKHL